VTNNKVVTLPLLAMRLILDRHERTRAPEATEVLGPGDSPAARHSGLLLPQNVVAALEKALRGSLIAGNSYHVALQPDEATALTGWCRAVGPSQARRTPQCFAIPLTSSTPPSKR